MAVDAWCSAALFTILLHASFVHGSRGGDRMGYLPAKVEDDSHRQVNDLDNIEQELRSRARRIPTMVLHPSDSMPSTLQKALTGLSQKTVTPTTSQTESTHQQHPTSRFHERREEIRPPLDNLFMIW